MVEHCWKKVTQFSQFQWYRKKTNTKTLRIEWPSILYVLGKRRPEAARVVFAPNSSVMVSRHTTDGGRTAEIIVVKELVSTLKLNLLIKCWCFVCSNKASTVYIVVHDTWQMSKFLKASSSMELREVLLIFKEAHFPLSFSETVHDVLVNSCYMHTTIQ